jgi:hypothetical protein
MKKIFLIQRKSLLAALVVFFLTSSCSETFLDINTDPNNPSSATLDLVMPAIQVGYVSALLRDVERASAAIVDQVHSASYGRWRLTESDFNNAWKGLYTDALADIEVVITQAEETNQMAYAGMAKIQKAYIYSLLVDLWGDVPFQEAIKAINPVYDPGEDIYPQLVTLIDEGIVDLGTGGSIQGSADMIYGGNKVNWVKMANSLKLKMLLQTRKVDPSASAAGISTIVSSG